MSDAPLTPEELVSLLEAHARVLPLELDLRQRLTNVLEAPPRLWQRLTQDEAHALEMVRAVKAGTVSSWSIGEDPTQELTEDTPRKKRIPRNVYYRDRYFYDYHTRSSKSAEFHQLWRDRAGEFPSFGDLHRKNDPVGRALDLG